MCDKNNNCACNQQKREIIKLLTSAAANCDSIVEMNEPKLAEVVKEQIQVALGKLRVP